MFDLNSVLKLHNEILNEYGGATGIRDSNLLDSALHRPFQTFDGVDLYKSVFEKTAAVMQSIIINHPFVDGNKRTGFLLGEILLLENSFAINAEEDVCYSFVIDISTGTFSFDDIVNWLRQHTQPVT